MNENETPQIETRETPLTPLMHVNGIMPVYSTAQEGFKFSLIPETAALIIDGKGWRAWSRGNISSSYIELKDVEEIPSFRETVWFTAAKIPNELFRKIVSFFTKVYELHKTEAVGYLYYHRENRMWDFVPPIQSCTSASTHHSHERPEGMEKSDGWLCVGTIHSHGSMGAFHSSTDDKDELDFSGIHITVGKVNTDNPEFACSIVANKTRTKFELGMLVEGFQVADVPNEWMEKLREGPPTRLLNHKDDDISEKAKGLYGAYLAGTITSGKYKSKIEKLEKITDSRSTVTYTPHGNSTIVVHGSSASKSWRTSGGGSGQVHQSSFLDGNNRKSTPLNHAKGCGCGACKLLEDDVQKLENSGAVVIHDGYFYSGWGD